MAAVCVRSIYENGLLSQTTGGTLRPGGFELTERLLSLCELPANAHVLDVGCGSGATVRYLRSASTFRAVGIDHSKYLLQSQDVIASNEAIPAEYNPPEGAALVCASGTSLPIGDCQMEAVLAECSLSAMIHFENTLAEFRRVLIPGGRLAVSDVYVRNPAGLPALRSIPLECGLRNALTKEDLLHRVEAQGFRTLHWEDHSDTLKTLAVQLIFSYGSLNAFWNLSLSQADDPSEIQQAVRAARIGYYLLVAQKETPWKI